MIARLQDRGITIQVRLRNRFGTMILLHGESKILTGKLFVPFCLFQFILGHSRRGRAEVNYHFANYHIAKYLKPLLTMFNLLTYLIWDRWL